jgi:hypothetical protein
MDTEIAHHRVVIVLEVEETALRPELSSGLLFCAFPCLGFAPRSCFDVLWKGRAASQSAQPVFDDLIAVPSSKVCKAIRGEILLSPNEVCDVAQKLNFARAAWCVFLDQKPM